jgi:hypothetical protein
MVGVGHQREIFLIFFTSGIALMDEANMIFKAMSRLTREHRGSHAMKCRILIHQSLDALESREVSVQPCRTGLSMPSPTILELVTCPVIMKPGASSLCCPDCQVPLDLHQPDEDQPTQLLGTCDGCSKWFYLVEIEPDWNGTLLFELPSAEALRARFASSRAR